MQFRFRECDNELRYKLVSIINIDDYDIMFKTLTYMKENECEYNIELNTENIVETEGKYYEVKDVSLCIPSSFDENAILPHFVVDVQEV